MLQQNPTLRRSVIAVLAASSFAVGAVACDDDDGNEDDLDNPVDGVDDQIDDELDTLDDEIDPEVTTPD
jgi:hypothetical protein